MKNFPRYWSFVRWIHRSPVNSPHKVQWRGALMFSLICSLNKRLSKTNVRLVTWDAIALIMTSLYGANCRSLSSITQSHNLTVVICNMYCLFTNLFTSIPTKNDKAPHHWPFGRGIHRWQVDSPDKGPVMRQTAPWHGFIMWFHQQSSCNTSFKISTKSMFRLSFEIYIS